MSKTLKVIVRALPERGFYRAGRHWPRTETEAEVTEEQLVALKAEMNLAVVVVPVAESAPTTDAGKKGK
jgi:hypothetical protein